uniref:Uncharacterized protein n=1 Tax=Rhizophora mucronata TaxID=61149 RepID=A0A2P2NE65_RHIMU
MKLYLIIVFYLLK